jgi:hypothetical protein
MIGLLKKYKHAEINWHAFPIADVLHSWIKNFPERSTTILLRAILERNILSQQLTYSLYNIKPAIIGNL